MKDQAIKQPIPRGGMGRSAIDEQEIQAIAQLLKTPENLFRYQGNVKGQCDLFEEEVCAKIGAKHALFVSSGTAALSCCLSAYRIGPGDEVIVPGYTYIATAAAVVDVGAVPIIAEIDESLGLDPRDVEKKITPYTKAMIVVHMQGVPARLEALRKIAKKHHLIVIEDCCQAIGAQYKGRYCGIESDAFAWSANSFKVLTCGEGGVFFTNNHKAFQLGVFQSDPAMQMWESSMQNDFSEEIAPFSRSGFRGNEIGATMLRVQLKKLDGLLQKTRGLKKLLLLKLNTPIHYVMQHVDDPEGDCGFSFAIIVKSQMLAKRFTEELKIEGLEIGSTYNAGFPDRHIYSYWNPILSKQGATSLGYPWKDPAYKGSVEYSASMCPNTLDILSRCLRLTLNIKMSEQNIVEIAEAINKVDRRL